jgi:hypothetical protein
VEPQAPLPASQNLAAIPFHDRHQIEETPLHADVGDIGAPDVVGPGDRLPPQQGGVDLVGRVLLAGIGFLEDRNQAHQPPHL